MSHELGAIKFKDGTIKYYEYNGTSDVPISHTYDTSSEVDKNWRNQSWLNCTCGQEEEVEIYTGGGYIEGGGKACRKCNSVRVNDPDAMLIWRNEIPEQYHWAKKLPEFNY